MDYESMSNEELEARNKELMAQKAAIREEQAAITAVLDARAQQQADERRLAGLTDEERDILVAVKAGKLSLGG